MKRIKSFGHPLWVTDQQFFMLDRAARKIQLWHPHDGVFYRINLDTWNVVKTRPTHANLLMGSFIWDGDGGMM